MNLIGSFIACGILIGLGAIVIYAFASRHPVMTTMVVGAALVATIRKDNE